MVKYSTERKKKKEKGQISNYKNEISRVRRYE